MIDTSMDGQQPRIDDTLVRALVRAQFPGWAHLPVRAVACGGCDNRSFHLGERMVVRLPTAAHYAAQVEKEHTWLPVLAPALPLPIPEPLALGAPGRGYPWRWSIYRWLDGETATPARMLDRRKFASDLAGFLVALQRIDPTGGPIPGPHNFHRGAPLDHYDGEARRAIAVLGSSLDVDAAHAIWEEALASRWHGPPVWIHGDVAPGNLLVNDGRLSAVIDFGMLGVGDPACDLSIAFTLFDGATREVFRAMLPYDAETWARARGWTLWKAAIVAAGLVRTNAIEAAQCRRALDEVVADHLSSG